VVKITFWRPSSPQSSRNDDKFLIGVPRILDSEMEWKYKMPLNVILFSYLQREVNNSDHAMNKM
jgi:hypothetical protein